MALSRSACSSSSVEAPPASASSILNAGSSGSVSSSFETASPGCAGSSSPASASAATKDSASASVSAYISSAVSLPAMISSGALACPPAMISLSLSAWAPVSDTSAAGLISCARRLASSIFSSAATAAFPASSVFSITSAASLLAFSASVYAALALSFASFDSRSARFKRSSSSSLVRFNISCRNITSWWLLPIWFKTLSEYSPSAIIFSFARRSRLRSVFSME